MGDLDRLGDVCKLCPPDVAVLVEAEAEDVVLRADGVECLPQKLSVQISGSVEQE